MALAGELAGRFGPEYVEIHDEVIDASMRLGLNPNGPRDKPGSVRLMNGDSYA